MVNAPPPPPSGGAGAKVRVRQVAQHSATNVHHPLIKHGLLENPLSIDDSYKPPNVEKLPLLCLITGRYNQIGLSLFSPKGQQYSN